MRRDYSVEAESLEGGNEQSGVASRSGSHPSSSLWDSITAADDMAAISDLRNDVAVIYEGFVRALSPTFNVITYLKAPRRAVDEGHTGAVQAYCETILQSDLSDAEKVGLLSQKSVAEDAAAAVDADAAAVDADAAAGGASASP